MAGSDHDGGEYEKHLDSLGKRFEVNSRSDVEAQKRETSVCKIGDLLKVVARLDLGGSCGDDTPSTLLPQGQAYRAQDLKRRGWDLVLVSDEDPPELRTRNGEIPQFFKALP